MKAETLHKTKKKDKIEVKVFMFVNYIEKEIKILTKN